MSMGREQGSFVSAATAKTPEDPFTVLYGEWLGLRARFNNAYADDMDDATMCELSDRESEVVRLICGTPARGVQLAQKIEVLEHYRDASDWCDQRDLRLIGSLKADIIACRYE